MGESSRRVILGLQGGKAPAVGFLFSWAARLCFHGNQLFSTGGGGEEKRGGEGRTRWWVRTEPPSRSHVACGREHRQQRKRHMATQAFLMTRRIMNMHSQVEQEVVEAFFRYTVMESDWRGEKKER